MSFEEFMDICKRVKIGYRVVLRKAFYICLFYIRRLVAQYYQVVSNYVLYIKKELLSIEEYYVKKYLFFDEDINKDVLIKQNRSLTFIETINLLGRRQKTKFYAPLLSFWPLFLTGSLAIFLMSMSVFFHSSKLYSYLNFLTIVSLIAVGVAVSFWFSIFFIEKKKGNHVAEIRRNIELGFYLFLFTEALCFIALFWVFLHSFLAASIHIGIYNPGEGIANMYINEFVEINKNFDVHYFKSVGTPAYFKTSTIYTLMDRELYSEKNVKIHINFFDCGQLINPYKLPLLNTFILLTSAATLNISHVSIRTSKYLQSFFWLFVTILLGLFFVSVQYMEYKNCSFQYNDGIFAACFFSLTGLHGIHVMLGISALIICAINLLFKNYSPKFHQSYTYSIFYWHFVDVIWILVYFIIYLWPASYFFIDDIYAVYKTFFVVNFSKNCFNKTIVFNTFLDYRRNNFVIYNNYCKSLDLAVLNFEISSKVENFYDYDKFHKPIWNKLKNELLFVNSYINKIKNLENTVKLSLELIEKYNATPVELIVSRILKYGNINYITYINTIGGSDKNYLDLGSLSSAISLEKNLKINNLLQNWIDPSLIEIKTDEDFDFVVKNFYLKIHEINTVRGSILLNYDAEDEYLRLELIRADFPINYNEVKRDPLLFCYILTEMHKELVSVYENAFINDLQGNYKVFMVYKILHTLGIEMLARLWCYFFLPYVYSGDASIRYRI